MVYLITIKKEFDYRINRIEPNVYEIELRDKGVKGRLVIYSIATNIYEREDQREELEDRLLIKYNISLGFRNLGERKSSVGTEESSVVDVLDKLKVVSEPFTEYELDNGMILRTKFIPAHIYLHWGKRDEVGDPIFAVKGSMLLSLTH
ncbi:MAG: hypothetical protein OWQ52_02015 [Metallosphaera prunae]|uniref:hypothetical protein n=1 Tax=Metallosphaera prunae TaxID=47304 RepID=UPI0022738449|nr:hypothetical protein [Metallosphaera prunae]MCY0861182.1 hypothetical protein [Metallosphaera prunae]